MGVSSLSSSPLSLFLFWSCYWWCNNVVVVVGHGCHPPCEFTEDDPDDCIVYGKIDDELIPWKRATQECLDDYNIVVSAPDPALICASANGFVNSLNSGRLSRSSVKYGLGIDEGGFFVEDSNTNLPILKDSITINGQTTDCTVMPVNCYTAMKPYFESDPAGIAEMMDVCDTLEGNLRVARETEQSTIRNRLCIEHFNENTAIKPSCDVLFQQVKMVKEEDYPDKICSSFAFGPGNTQLPECAPSDGNDDTDDNEPGSSGTYYYYKKFSFINIVVLVCMLLTFICSV